MTITDQAAKHCVPGVLGAINHHYHDGSGAIILATGVISLTCAIAFKTIQFEPQSRFKRVKNIITKEDQKFTNQLRNTCPALTKIAFTAISLVSAVLCFYIAADSLEKREAFCRYLGSPL